MRSKVIALTLTILCFPVTAAAATYYVDNSGRAHCRDLPSYGSEQSAWCAISYGLGQMKGGDTLYIKSGTYEETLSISSRLSGRAGNVTEIKAYPGASVTVRGSAVNTGRIRIAGSSYIALDGVAVTNMNHGIHVESSRHISIRNCAVYYIGQEGIHISGNSEHITIQDCKVYETGRWIYNGEGIYIGTGSTGTRDNTNHITIRNNIVHDTTDEAIELKPGTHHCLVEGNRVYNARTGSTWGAIEIGEHAAGNQYWGEHPGHVVRNNIIYGSDTAIRAGTGSLIYNNLIYAVRHGGYGIYVDNRASDSHTRAIYHNTIDMHHSTAIHVRSGRTEIKNNLGPSMANNLRVDRSYFVDSSRRDYRLASGGAPIDAGVDLSRIVSIDLDGNHRPAGLLPDLGAYEFRP